MAFTRMPYGAHSIASSRVNWLIAPLPTLYAKLPRPSADEPAIELRLTIEPPRSRAIMRRPACCAQRKYPVTPISSTLFHSSNGRSAGWAWLPLKAQFTRTSTRPISASISANAFPTASGLDTSQVRANARRPRSVTSRAVCPPCSGSSSSPTTSAPAPAKVKAISRPIPDPQPVTTATLSVRRNGESADGRVSGMRHVSQAADGRRLDMDVGPLEHLFAQSGSQPRPLLECQQAVANGNGLRQDIVVPAEIVPADGFDDHGVGRMEGEVRGRPEGDGADGVVRRD